jgi:hypothetical protein
MYGIGVSLFCSRSTGIRAHAPSLIGFGAILVNSADGRLEPEGVRLPQILTTEHSPTTLSLLFYRRGGYDRFAPCSRTL